MLKARVITALFLVVGLLSLLFFVPAIAVAVVFAGIAALGGWEWAGLMKMEKAARALFGGLILILCWMVRDAAAELFPTLWLLSALFWLLVSPWWLRRRWSLGGNDFGAYALGALLLVSTWASLVSLYQRGPVLLLAVLAAIWVADIAAYFAGRAFGKMKLAPEISPGKTREGAYGAVIGVTIYGLSVWPWLGVAYPGEWLDWLVLALALVLLTVLSIMGDLFESLLKRQAGIKDSSQILPGHGGILDRIDSLISTLPLVTLMLLYYR